MFDLDLTELEEWGEDLYEYGVKNMPNVSKKFLRKEAGELRKAVVRRTKAVAGKKTGNLVRGIRKGKIIYEYNGVDYNIRVYNAAPHAHLIEYGHRMVGHKPNKTSNGLYVRGFHPVENAAIEFEPKYQRDIETVLIQAIKEELER